MCQCFHLLGFTPSTVCVEILRQPAVFLHPPRCVLTDSRLLLLCFSHTSLKTGTNIEPLEAWLSTVDRFLCAVVCVCVSAPVGAAQVESLARHIRRLATKTDFIRAATSDNGKQAMREEAEKSGRVLACDVVPSTESAARARL